MHLPFLSEFNFGSLQATLVQCLGLDSLAVVMGQGHYTIQVALNMFYCY